MPLEATQILHSSHLIDRNSALTRDKLFDSTTTRRQGTLVAQARWSVQTNDHAESRFNAIVRSPLGRQPKRFKHGSNMAAPRAGAVNSVLHVPKTRCRRSKSPDTDADGEILSEEEPEVLPMPQWNILSNPKAEDLTGTEIASPTDFDPRFTVKTETARRSLTYTLDDESHTSRVTGTSISRPPTARPPRYLQLSPLRLFLARTKYTTAWEESNEGQNPLYSFCHDPMMHINVMDMLVQYLQQHSLVASGMLHNVAVVPPSIYQLVLCSAGRASKHVEAIQAVWQHAALPTYIILPVVHNEHWFVWRGAVWQEEGLGWECDLRYLSSLGRPPQDILDTRADSVRRVVHILFPRLQRIRTRHNHIDGFKQARGSSDCGVFAAQAMSAFLFEQPGALENLLPVARVKQRIVDILNACASGILDSISNGLIPQNVSLLHDHRSRDQDPAFQPISKEDVFYDIPNLCPLLRRVITPSLQDRRTTYSATTRADTVSDSSELAGFRSSEAPQQHLPQVSQSSRSVERNRTHPEPSRDMSLKFTLTISWDGSSTD